MAKDADDNDKPDEVLEAEAHGGQTFDPTVDQPAPKAKADEPLASGACPDCRGEGIRDPQATQVCQTCQGTGKA